MISNRGGALSRKTIWNMVKHSCMTAGISKNITPHTNMLAWRPDKKTNIHQNQRGIA